MLRRTFLRRTKQTPFSVLVAGLVLMLVVAGCQAPVAPAAPADSATAVPAEEAAGDGEAGSLVVYSGRNENLVGPLLDQFSAETGIQVEVRYGGTAEMAATILEEGQNSPADLFYGQDAGALGALAHTERCIELPEDVLQQVDQRFVSPEGQWVGTSGRARVLVYNTEELSAEDLPASVFDLVGEEWRGRVGWAPTNGSFQAFVTAMRVLEGDDVTREWLEGMIANDVQVYPNNTSIVEATGRGEIGVGLVNHYYLYRFLSEDPDFAAANFHFPGGDLGSMVNVAGVCIIDTAANPDAALSLVRYLLSDEAQQFFADETTEYPLVGADVTIDERLVPLAEIDAPDMDLSNIEDLQGTLIMLQDVGALD